MELLKQKTALYLHSAINGDANAFEKLVLMYQDKVYSLAYRLTGTALDAEDLAQEVFIKAYRNMRSFRGDSDFGTWLYRITVNTWLNDKRKKQPKAVFSLDDLMISDDGEVRREIPDVSNDPGRVLIDSDMDERLLAAVERLPKDQKAVLMLREVDEKTYEEIAGIMNCSIGTVRSRLSRSREALKKIYNGCFEH